MTLTESDIEEAALSRLASLGYTVTPGPYIASWRAQRLLSRATARVYFL
ncbi:MAG: hypothetical protein NTX42_11795 [Methanothrix sp.]|nr:hypothetical protein [Methanothrix sp.]